MLWNLFRSRPLCLIVGHYWGPWLPCKDGVTRRWCNRCEARQP